MVTVINVIIINQLLVTVINVIKYVMVTVVNVIIINQLLVTVINVINVINLREPNVIVKLINTYILGNQM